MQFADIRAISYNLQGVQDQNLPKEMAITL